MGLLRGVARTAVIAGTATSVSNRVSRRQANRWAQQDYAEQQQYAQPQPAQPQPEGPAPAAGDTASQLKQLADLRAQGALSDAEFQQAKAKLLA
ncbi:MAG: SHOCT domain-containing protein [Acidimicrobiia bacterium]|nr:SHOCT domain-containing protein [Acidimicrobiia bacterium]